MFDKLYIAVIAALKTPAVVEAAAKVSLQVVGDTPEVAAKKLVEEAALYAIVAKKLGIKAE